MRLEPYLQPDRILVLTDCGDLAALMGRLADAALAGLPDLTREALVEALLERERRHPTSTPEGVAFPHAMLPAIHKTLIIPAMVKPAVPFGVRAHPPADLVFCMFGDSNEPFSHVRLLARLARIAHSPGALDRLRAAGDASELYAILVAEDRAHG